MFESFRRAQLTRDGFSCGRTRRKHQEDDFWDMLRTHHSVTGAIAAGFILGVLVLMQVAADVGPGIARPGPTKWLYGVVLSLGALTHLHIANRQARQDNAASALILSTLLLHLAVTIAMMRFGGMEGWSGVLLATALPHAISPFVLSIMQGRRTGMFAAVHASVLGALVVPFVNPLTWLTTSLLVGSVAVLATRRVRRRNRFLMAGLCVGGSAAMLSLLLSLTEGTLDATPWLRLLGFPLASGVLTGLLVGGFLPLLETTFDVTTDITWLELSDLNHPLMRRLSMEAPGTYHHSLVVANLAEAAAECIGAGATMTRVCAYFHDIGKLNKPEYFIENMDSTQNPHKDLTARMSTLILVAHVKDGVDLAIKHNLNHKIIDVIEQHHGTSLAWFFYQQALNQKAEMLRLVKEDKASEDDVPQISEDVFRYPGPKPQFKESAIISLADAVESASRTLDKPTAQRIEQMVDEIVQTRMYDTQLDECDLTLAELARVKASFVKTLMSMMHTRIKYQQRNITGTSLTTTEPQPNPATVVLGEAPPDSAGGTRKPARRRASSGQGPSAA